MGATALALLVASGPSNVAHAAAVTLPAPSVDMTTLRWVAPHVLVASDRGIPLVPNIGIIEGTKAILVVDTGLRPANSEICNFITCYS